MFSDPLELVLSILRDFSRYHRIKGELAYETERPAASHSHRVCHGRYGYGHYRRELRFPHHGGGRHLRCHLRRGGGWTQVRPHGGGKRRGVRRGGAPCGGYPLRGGGEQPPSAGTHGRKLVRPSRLRNDHDRRDGHQRQDHLHLPHQEHFGAEGGSKGGSRGHDSEHDRQGSAAHRAHYPRILRAAPPVPSDGGRGLLPRGDGGLLPRTEPRPRVWHPLRRRYLHQLEPRPSGLP